MLYRNFSLAMSLLVIVLPTLLAGAVHAEDPTSRARPAPGECQLYPDVATFQEFFNPNDYDWQGTWDPQWNWYGVPRQDRDYDREATIDYNRSLEAPAAHDYDYAAKAPARDCGCAVKTPARHYDCSLRATARNNYCAAGAAGKKCSSCLR